MNYGPGLRLLHTGKALWQPRPTPSPQSLASLEEEKVKEGAGEACLGSTLGNLACDFNLDVMF